MKRLTFLLLILMSSTFVFSQEENTPPPQPPPPPPMPVKEKVVKEAVMEEPEFIDMDVEEETVIEEAGYAYPEVVEEAPVKEVYNSKYRSKSNNSKYETIGIYGEYEYVYERFNNDSYSGRDYGVLKQGELLLPMIFKKQGYYSNSKEKLILSLGKTYGLYNLETENWDVPLEYSSLRFLSKNMYIAMKGSNAGIVDENNNVITDFNWSSISTISGLENYVYVHEKSSSHQRKGIFSIVANKLTVELQYKSIEKVQDENYFKVKNDRDEYNIIDINDKPRFKNWYKELTVARGGRKCYIVKKDSRMGIIDDNEKSIVAIDYEYIKNSPYNDGSYLARNKKGKYGCISIDGTVTLPFEYDNLDIMGYGNIAISGKGNKCGIVQVNNGLPFEIATCDFDDISKNAKVFIVKQNSKFGIMDLYGKMKTELDYNEINSISNDLLVARQKSKWSLMNNSGEKLTSKDYLKIETLIDQGQESSYYSNKKFSYLQVQHANKKYGIVDKLGNEITGPIFESLLSESKNIVLAKNNGKLGLYNLLTKKDVLPYEYDQITYSEKGYYAFKGKDIYLITDPGKGNPVKF